MVVVARERLVGGDGGEERKSGGRHPDALRLARGGRHEAGAGRAHGRGAGGAEREAGSTSGGTVKSGGPNKKRRRRKRCSPRFNK